ncbi:hypothetical protein BU16DRAFT_238272 [Lophium mytilinum]|uniref:Uncharacterized protein n=1 Tax=Lophium mytilinum TaxID=390894 RepID=A0A6A6R8H6_9PEZI|nr:hypothetical protein BU16DRAFT_238272 [Lophium mytilinum]
MLPVCPMYAAPVLALRRPASHSLSQRLPRSVSPLRCSLRRAVVTAASHGRWPQPPPSWVVGPSCATRCRSLVSPQASSKSQGLPACQGHGGELLGSAGGGRVHGWTAGRGLLKRQTQTRWSFINQILNASTLSGLFRDPPGALVGPANRLIIAKC